jgi:hypothetical protein
VGTWWPAATATSSGTSSSPSTSAASPSPDDPRWPKASTWVLEGPIGAALEGTPEERSASDLLTPAHLTARG